MLGLYIHIPFCKAICTYCDFPKEIATKEKQNAYLDALMKELTYYQPHLQTIDTIYIGGGTPTALEDDQLINLLSSIAITINLDRIKEYTIEANPNDITLNNVKILKNYGINRVSLGVQTFNQKILSSLNRKHSNKDVYQAIDLLHSVGINNISIDLIFNLPNQRLSDVYSDLEEALKLKIKHLSYYSLILEEHTKLYYDVLNQAVTLNGEDIEADMYEAILDVLSGSAFKQYEISNFAKESYSSKHNLIYWHNHDYIGIGAGSHGKYHQKRYYNVRSVKYYIEQVDRLNHGKAEEYPYEALRDTFLMGLRLTKGVNLNGINKAFNIDVLKTYPKLRYYINEGYLTLKNNYLRFTRKGLLLGNEIFAIF